jgi:cell wall-associated NlpC family hydrolase
VIDIDASRYVGLPFRDHGRDRRGVDCWGLVHLIYADAGIALPSYVGDYVSIEERAEIEALIAGGRAAGPWFPVEGKRPFDVIVLKMLGHASHVGVSLGRGLMIHAHTDQVKVARLKEPGWKRRIVGAWRHERFT